MAMIGVVELILLLILLGGGVLVVSRLFGGGRSNGQDASTPVAHGMTLKCPSCGRETAADRPNCSNCGAEL